MHPLSFVTQNGFFGYIISLVFCRDSLKHILSVKISEGACVNTKVTDGMLKRVTAILMSLLIAWIFCIRIGAGESSSSGEDCVQNEEETVIERMIRGFEEHEESIDISEYAISVDELGKLFADATKNSPYLFYVGNDLSYTYRKSGEVVSLYPKYECTREEALERVELCRAEIKKLAELISSATTELERIEAAHDLICMRYKYDLTLESNDMYSFLMRGEGTCQGYTWTYMALLRELGIECEYVASDRIKHIWLKLKTDGEWYHSDVTWDDPPGDEGKGENVSRRHFLFSDAKADNDGYSERYSGGEGLCKSPMYDREEPVYYHAHGDIDHNGRVELDDLVFLRRYSELGEKIDICPICADPSGDLLIGDADIDRIRGLLLNSP